jgi:hypothetical protein
MSVLAIRHAAYSVLCAVLAGVLGAGLARAAEDDSAAARLLPAPVVRDVTVGNATSAVVPEPTRAHVSLIPMTERVVRSRRIEEPTWSVPTETAPEPTAWTLTRAQPDEPPPPPPPPGDTTAPDWSCPPTATPSPAQQPPPQTSSGLPPPDQRKWSGKGLCCEDGISLWHVRAVGGRAFCFGTDPFDPCVYYGLDIGREFCGCWGLDFYYRLNSGRFDRDEPGFTRLHDGGWMHHFGGKLTYERSIDRSDWYWWVGLGAGYFKTVDYVHNDSGFEGFGEAGIGYIFSEHFRARLGVNVHGLNTTVTRKNPPNDGQSRFLWIVAPVLELEVDF